MGGSMKGERRGAAGRSGKRRAGRPKGSKNKWDVNSPRSVAGALNRPATIKDEREREIMELATGRMDLMPKQVLRRIMEYFYGVALTWQSVAERNLEAAVAAPEGSAARLAFEQAVDYAESRVKEYFVTAGDFAYKAAPYFHPRLAAIVTNPQLGGDKGPLNVMRELLDEIDRDSRTIEHNPNEGVAIEYQNGHG